MTALRRKTYLIQDPYDEDAVQFIRTMFLSFGLRPICFYTDPKGRFYGEAHYPILRGDAIEARYDVDLTELASFAEAVKRRYEVLAVIPYREDTVEVAAALCAHFDFQWNAPEILGRFRDKFALKSYLQSQGGTVRVPACRLVRRLEDVWDGAVPARFVLKPNDGFGNRQIGIFDAADRAGVAAHLARAPGTTWILEEFIAGPEFSVNGQVRTDGEVTVLAIIEYVRREVNGQPTVYEGEFQLRRSHPLFAPLADYATRLMRATGLQRCPFHMEVRVDAAGPCMVDLGARFPSEGAAHLLSRMHPRRPDAFTVACHDYLGENRFATEPVDWTHYDAQVAMLVYGISTEAGIVHRVEGVDEVEALPEFVNWAYKPEVGHYAPRTIDLGSKAYLVELTHQGDDAYGRALMARVRAAIRINATRSWPSWLGAQLTRLVARAGPKLRWMVHRAVRPFSGRAG
jgi:hypothetical protein